MIKRILFTLALLLSTNFYAQIHFEKGYFIDNNDVKTVCFIKNGGWKNNPSKFEYKVSENDDLIKEIDIKNTKEVSFDNWFTYQRFDVKIDKSTTDINSLSRDSNPEWIEKTVFLKIIQKGDAVLYEHTDNIGSKYFYSFKNAPVEQLVYKEYLVQQKDGYTFVHKNKFYLKQLLGIKCESTDIRKIDRIEYKKKQLLTYFTEVNTCRGSNVVAEEYNQTNTNSSNEKGKFSLTPIVGVNFNSLSIDRGNPSVINPNFEFGKVKTYKLGFDMEYIFPTNRNKWALDFEVAYQSKYESEATVIQQYKPIQNVQHWGVSYSCIDLGIGIKYYMFINDNSKIFLNGQLMYSPVINGFISNYEIESKPYLAFGLGYKYKKYSLGLKYSKRNIIGDYAQSTSKYTSVSVFLGYTIIESNKKK